MYENIKSAVVGSINMDMILTADRIPDVGENLQGNSYSYANGGKGANQATALARLGAEVKMIGKVGNDANGKKLIENLEANNIDFVATDLKEQKPNRSQLEDWFNKSGLPLKKFFNTSGQVYKSMELKDKLPAMSQDEQLDLLASDGMLVKRPIVVSGDKVLVGFKEVEWEESLK